MTIEDDLKLIAEQERLLRFTTFTAEMAWQVGCLLRAAAVEKDASMTFEVCLAGRTLFYAVTGERAAAGAGGLDSPQAQHRAAVWAFFVQHGT